MNLAKIKKAINSDRVNITAHARKEARNDLLILDEIFFASKNGEIIEDYPDDKPYPSCLIYGTTTANDPIHSVWAYDIGSKIAILITVYRPDPTQWTNWKERKKL